MIIGIIGNGFVGKATTQLKCKGIELLAYDINPEACEPAGLTLQDMNKCEVIFISVPTPMSKEELNELLGPDPYLGPTSWLSSQEESQ